MNPAIISRITREDVLPPYHLLTNWVKDHVPVCAGILPKDSSDFGCYCCDRRGNPWKAQQVCRTLNTPNYLRIKLCTVIANKQENIGWRHQQMCSWVGKTLYTRTILPNLNFLELIACISCRRTVVPTLTHYMSKYFRTYAISCICRNFSFSMFLFVPLCNRTCLATK